MEDSCPLNNAAQQAEAQRFRKQSKKIGRKLSRRLSLITKVPNIFNVKFAGSESPSTPHKIVHGVSSAAADVAIPQAHEITVIAPDKTQRLMTGSSDQTIKQLLAGLVFEFSLEHPGYYLGGSLAEIDENATIDFLVGDIVIVQEDQFRSNQKHENDGRYCLTEKFIHDEMAYITCLKSAKELYGEPLRRMDILSIEEYDLIFEKLLKVADKCSQVVQELQSVIENWDPVFAQIGSLFSTNFWDHYNDYQDVHRHAKELLREKAALDEDFVAFCVQRKGAAKNSLRHIIDFPPRQDSKYLDNVVSKVVIYNERQIGL